MGCLATFRAATGVGEACVSVRVSARTSALGTSTLRASALYAGALCVSALCVMTACVDKTAPVAPAIPPTSLVYALQASPRGITMAVGDTLRLSTRATSLAGTPIDMSGLPTPTFTSLAPITVTVDSTGLLTAQSVGGPAQIVVTQTINGVTRVDTASVLVTDMRVTPTAFQIVVLDSTKLGIGAYDFFLLSVTDADGNDLSAALNTSTTVSVPGRAVSAVTFGNIGFVINNSELNDFWIHVATTMYGVTLADSVEYHGGYPALAGLGIVEDTTLHILKTTLNGATQFLQTCGTFSVTNYSSKTLDIVFDPPGNIGQCGTPTDTGTITGLGPNQTATRVVATAGTVTWTARLTGGAALSPAVTGKLLAQ